MKNRPVASFANQTKDVFGSQQKSTRTTVTGVLIVLMLVLTVIFLINGGWIAAAIFGTILVLLIAALFIGRRADRYNTPVKPEDSPEAIFKEHEI